MAKPNDTCNTLNDHLQVQFRSYKNSRKNMAQEKNGR